jgi:D-amino-acid dehydrogenase
MPVKNPSAAWTVSLSDEAHKLVLSRLGERLRIAGTAELAGYDTSINETRCRAILERTLELFPGAGDPAHVQYWAGLRPATPGNIPYIGRTRYRNLFPQHRPRDAGLDARVRLGTRACGYHRRTQARG